MKTLITALIGIFALSYSLDGYMKKGLNLLFRGALFSAALLLINTGVWTDAIGLLIVALVCWFH